MGRRNTRVCVLLYMVTTLCLTYGAGSEESVLADTPSLSIYVRGHWTDERLGVGDVHDDPSIIILEEALNVDLQFVFSPSAWSQWDTQVSLLIASGAMPDIMHLPLTSAQRSRSWRDLFVDLDEVVTKDEYPYIYRVINADSFRALRQNGRAYVIAGTFHGSWWNFRFRRDWLYALGMELPSTPDDLYDVLYAFTMYDPDGNGVDDSVGLVAWAGGSGLDGFEPVFRAFNASTRFVYDLEVVDGRVVSTANSEGTRDALIYCNRLFRSGLVNADFLDVTRLDSYSVWLYSNRGGAFFGPASAVHPDAIARMGLDGSPFISASPPVVAPGYRLNGVGVTPDHLIGVSSSSKYVTSALELVEFANSRRGRELLVAGVEERHWSNMVDGLYDLNMDNWRADYWQGDDYLGKSWPHWRYLFTSTHGYIPAAEYPSFEGAFANIEIFSTRDDYRSRVGFKWGVEDARELVVPNPFDLAFVPEAEQIRSYLEDVRAHYFARMIVADEGQVVTLWDEYEKAVREGGFEDYVEAYQGYYESNFE